MKFAALLTGVSVFGFAYVGLGWLGEWWCKADPIDESPTADLDRAMANVIKYAKENHDG